MSIQDDFIRYKQDSIQEKETLKKEVEKCNLQIQKFVQKTQKKYEQKIQELRKLFKDETIHLQNKHQNQVQYFEEKLKLKDQVIEELRNKLKNTQEQKRKIIDDNTKILLEMSKDLAQNTNTNVLKMYQYLLQENNAMKKEKKKAKVNTQHEVSKMESSMLSKSKKSNAAKKSK